MAVDQVCFQLLCLDTFSRHARQNTEVVPNCAHSQFWAGQHLRL